MSTFVLVHGSWMGSWAWDDLKPLLTAAGHRVVTPNLPGYAPDDTTPRGELTLQLAAERIGAVLEAEGQPEPVILVGHSMGGIVISSAAEGRPDRVARLVYVAAFLLRDGEALFPVAQSSPDWGKSGLNGNLVIEQEQNRSRVSGPTPASEIFLNAGTPEQRRALEPKMQPDAVLPGLTPIHVTPERWGRLPRVYVETLQDHVIPIGLQRQMVAASGVGHVYTLDTDHSPFVSRPRELADILLAQVGVG